MKKQYLYVAIILFLSTVFCFVLFKTSVTEYMQKGSMFNPYNSWGEGLDYNETSGPDELAKQHYWMTRDPKTGEVPAHLAFEEYERIRNQKMVDPLNILWEERGPKNVGGRTRALMWDPNDLLHRKLWAGGVSGGLWYKDNILGNTFPAFPWEKVDDFWDNLAISCLAYDPSNTQVFYAGTGEACNAIEGWGIWKSTDGGATWNKLASTNGDVFNYIQKIVVHPVNRYVYAATRDTGVVRSTDGGLSWEAVLNTNTTPNPSLKNWAADLEITANGEILASLGFDGYSDGVYISSTGNAGDWTRLNNGGNGFPTSADGLKRIELAVAPSDENVIYALVQGNDINRPTVFDSDIKGIYRSSNKGVTWESLTIPILRICHDGQCGGVANDGDTIFFSATQTGYDLIAAVHPDSPDTIFIGGINSYRSTNGGDTWEWIDGGHDDYHALAFRPGDPKTLVFGNDGGVYISRDCIAGEPASDGNLGYRVTQLHSCAVHPVSGVNYMLAGAQDNGSHQFVSPGLNNTKGVVGGDGGYCYIFKQNPNYQIVSTQYDRFFLSTDNGAPFESIYESGPTADLISPWDYDESTNTIYAAYDERNIFILNNATTEPVVYQTCYSSIVGHNNLFYNKATAFKVSPFVDSTVFVGTNFGELYKLTYAFDTLNCVIDSLTGPFQGSGRYLNCIEFGANENQIIVVFSNYGIPSVWETLDGGASWENREGDLPNIPIYWAIYNPLDNRQVLLATELGVYTTEDITASTVHWAPANNGMPIVRTTMLKVRESDNLVIASTFGRGIFSTNSLTVSPSTKILANDGQDGDVFGTTVATNGDFAIVGAPDEDEKGNDAGAVYIYEQLNNRWTESIKVLAPDGTSGDHFGKSVDMNSDLAIIGGGSSAYIYRLSGNSWNFEEKITPNDGHAGDRFGSSLAIIGDVAAVGASGSGGKGAVYLFTYQSGNWIQTDKIIAADGVDGDNFGYSLDLYGNYLIVGCPQDDLLMGSAYIYQYFTGWTLDKKITADDGNDSQNFGQSVAIYNNKAVVGSPYADGKPGVLSPGAAYVYFNSLGSNWEQTAKLWAPDGWTLQRFGQSVSVFEDYIIIGAPRDYEFDFAGGAAYVFKDEGGAGTNWLRQNKLFAEDGGGDDWFGYSVHLYGTTAIVSSVFDDDKGSNSGSAYIFNSIVNAYNLPILSVTPPFIDVTSAQNTVNIQINNNGPGNNMNWKAFTYDPWLHFTGDSSGTNSGTLTVSVDENLYCARKGRILVRAPGSLHSLREVFIHQGTGPNTNEVNLTLPDLNENDGFGGWIDVDGEYAIIGAAGDDQYGTDAGAAYIFERDGCCSWIQKAKLHLSTYIEDHNFGYSVAISGDVAIVSALEIENPRIYIFQKPSGGWQDMTESATLYPPVSLSVYHGFGSAIDISGDYVVASNSGTYNPYIVFYERPAGGWHDMSPTTYFEKTASESGFGISVCIDGLYAVIGSHQENAGAGCIYVYKNDYSWREEARLTASDGTSGAQFGKSVDLSDNLIIVGAHIKKAAYIFRNNDNQWVEEQKLVSPTGTFGFAIGIKPVAIHDNIAVVGDKSYSVTSGCVFSFVYDSTGWSLSKQTSPIDVQLGDGFGYSVDISGSYTIVSSPGKKNSNGLHTGGAYIFCTESDIVSSVLTPQEQILPVSYDLKQNYPNPFNPVTTIVFDLPRPTDVTLKIYTILGEEVTTLVSDKLPAGTHKYIWNPVSLASGIYLYRIKSKEYTETKKMMLIK